MARFFASLIALCFASSAWAADNTVIVTPGSGVTMKSKDVGAGVQAMQPVLSDTGGNALSTPTAGSDGANNTLTGLLSYGRIFWFNGTTWDSARGDATNGGWVNIKSSVALTANMRDGSGNALSSTGGSLNVDVTNATSPGQAVMASSQPVVFASDQAGTCTLHAFKHITSATDTLAVQGVTAQTVRVCAWKARAAGTATWYWENTGDTNANCAGSKTQISGVATEAANTGEVVALPLGVTLNNTSGNGLCINSTGTGGVDIDFWYAQR